MNAAVQIRAIPIPFQLRVCGDSGDLDSRCVSRIQGLHEVGNTELELCIESGVVEHLTRLTGCFEDHAPVVPD